jgi:hypothetical protein
MFSVTSGSTTLAVRVSGMKPIAPNSTSITSAAPTMAANEVTRRNPVILSP